MNHKPRQNPTFGKVVRLLEVVPYIADSEYPYEPIKSRRDKVRKRIRRAQAKKLCPGGDSFSSNEFFGWAIEVWPSLERENEARLDQHKFHHDRVVKVLGLEVETKLGEPVPVDLPNDLKELKERLLASEIALHKANRKNS
jgi:hypothetical protein